MSKPMRARLVVESVTKMEAGGEPYEILKFRAVGPDASYPEDGSDGNNSYAKFTPSFSAEMHLRNPALADTYKPGDAFLVDFTPVAAC